MKSYDRMLKLILEHGENTWNTKRLLGIQCRYNLHEKFPLLTKRKLWPKSIFGELLWILNGKTDILNLHNYGCGFWDNFIDECDPLNLAFHQRTKIPYGFFGPIYGFQLRHFGADYKDYLEKGYAFGFDQWTYLINNLKPNSRRHVVSYWNPMDLDMMRLPPCHYSFHVDIDNDQCLTLILNQRSADMMLGVPNNVACYAAMAHIIANMVNAKPSLLIHNMEDAHIYHNQMDTAKEYLSRVGPESVPQLRVAKKRYVEELTQEDFVVEGYAPLPKIDIPLTVT